MSVYGNNIILDENYLNNQLESVEVISEESSLGEKIETTVRIINFAFFAGAIAFNCIKSIGKDLSSEKLTSIGREYKKNDEKFILRSDLHKKTFSCKKFFDNNYKKEKELTGIKRIFAGFYPSVAIIYYDKNNKEIFTYFRTKEWKAEINGIFPSDGATIESDTTHFYFKLIDKSLEKYKLYYLSVACLDEDKMVLEAKNWINSEYKKLGLKDI